MKKICLLNVFFIFWVAISHSQSIVLDSSFGANGITSTTIAGSNGKQVLIRNDGTMYLIIVPGDIFSPSQSVITHILNDGAIDASYGNNGYSQSVPVSISGGALQSDGKIVAAGGSNIFRFNTDGTLDNNFGENGKVIVDFHKDRSGVAAVAIQEDGKIIVAGNSLDFETGFDFAVARYNADGTPDITFSEDGVQVTDAGRYFDVAEAIAIQNDGKILVAGSTKTEESFYADFALVRYNTDGTLDMTFSEDGKQRADFAGDNDPTSIALQSDGKIVVAGFNYPPSEDAFHDKINFAIARFNTDGSFDITFSGGRQFTELVTVPPSDGIPPHADGIIQSDGKIVVAGFNTIARYNSNGSVDATFSDDGKQTIDLEIFSSAIQNDGKIVVAGSNGSGFAVVARYIFLTPPQVKINSPIEGTKYTAKATIILSADATDADGKVKTVSFYNGDKLIFTELAPPFYRKWFGVKEGDYTITAKATDDDGHETTSAPVHITVLPSTSPSVTITRPLHESNFAAGSDIVLSADAIAPGIGISKVDFYSNGKIVLTEYKAPYYNKWRNVPPGNYSILARATDSNGNIITSQNIVITVTGPLARSILKEDKQSSTERPLNLNVNPNPVANVLNISVEGLRENNKSTISIISASGVVVKTIQAKNLNRNTKLDVSSLSSGVYILKVANGDKIVYKQFVKL